MYAVIRTGGKQYRVAPGQVLKVGKIEGAIDTVEIDDILILGDEGKLSLNPSGAKVICQVLRQGRSRKILGMKMKRRKDYRRKLGHRQHYTQLRVQEIVA